MDESVGGSVARTYAYGLSRISESQLVNGSWTPSFYGYDGHGSARFLANSAGTVTDTYTYDAFGAQIATTGTTPNPYLYSGERFDSFLNLYDLRARYYNMLTGRFETIDPAAGKIYDPRTLHKYLYAGADPVNASDPTGKDLFENVLIEGGSLPAYPGLRAIGYAAAYAFCEVAKPLGGVFQNWTPGAPSPIIVPIWGIKGAAALCTALGF